MSSDQNLQLTSRNTDGRRLYFEILDSYLRKNLAVNGGWLDEVRFVMHTDVTADIDFLEDLVKQDDLEDYYKIMYEDYSTKGTVWGTFPKVWEHFATDEDALYIKMDDDLVFIDENAIPRIVTTLLAHPEAHSVLGNSINNRWNHYFHHGTGAILPYLPEPPRSSTGKREISWRASSLPRYEESLLPSVGEGPYMPPNFAPPFKGHCWLPLPRSEKHLLRTPFGDGSRLPDPKNSTKGPPVNWQIAAQEHYSFLEHLENEELSVYAFGRPSDGLWNIRYQHYNIHFMAFWGRTMRMRSFWGDPDDPQFIKNDEVALTMIIPKELNMPVLVDTRVIVAHFAFHDAGQRQDVLKTDLLDRYRDLADEKSGMKHNWKIPNPAGAG